MSETGENSTYLDRASPVYCADEDVHNPSVDGHSYGFKGDDMRGRLYRENGCSKK